MPFDHKETAAELERTAQVIKNMADNIGSVAAYKEAERQKEHLLGLADWHKAQHEEKEEAYKRLSRLGKSAKKVFGKFPQNDLTSH